jgi:hypothetical protein
MLNTNKAFLHKQSLQIRIRAKKAALAFAIFSLGFSLQSCQKEELAQVAPEITISGSAVETNNLQTAFAKILSSAIKADPELRTFLKEEAIKEFNGDNDILYQMVKDKSINGGETFHARLAHYAEAAQLAEIEQKSPLLTIFIPTLPSGFTAATWNARADAPMVAVCLRGSNSVPYYDGEGNEHIVPDRAIPGFPVIVIKQNERVTTKQVQAGGESLQFYQNDKFSFSFIDANFDFIHSNVIATRLKQEKNRQSAEKDGANRWAGPFSLDTKVTDAYQLNGTDPTIQWQRDYVYYGITANNSRGPLDRNFREVMRTIRFSTDALFKMSDQREGNLKDPSLNHAPLIGNSPNWWTDGRFEIQVSVLINANNGIGPTFNPVIPIDPRSLFDITYYQSGYNYFISEIIPKDFFILLPILPWDLKVYGDTWKFSIVERDNTGTDKLTVQNSASTAVNFNFEPTIAEFVKIGAKFGVTSNTSTNVSHEVTINLGDDDLSNAILSFDRPIITGVTGTPGPGNVTYEINNGPNSYFSTSIEPMRY